MAFRQQSFLAESIRPKITTDQHLNAACPILMEGDWPCVRKVCEGLCLVPARAPSIEEEAYHLTTFSTATSSQGQTRMVSLILDFLLPPWLMQKAGWALPSHLWSWFRREDRSIHGRAAIPWEFPQPVSLFSGVETHCLLGR